MFIACPSTFMAPRKPPPPLSIAPFPNTDPDSPLQLSSPSTPSSSNSQLSFSLNLGPLQDESDVTSSSDADLGTTDDISKDLEVLEKLRKSVQKNLRLRPIKSSSSLPKVSPIQPPDIVSPASS